MWAIAVSMFAGFKWLSWSASRANALPNSPTDALGYFLLWPGMNPSEYLSKPSEQPRPSLTRILVSLLRVSLGAAILWGVARLFFPVHPRLAGWTGAVGLMFFLHFGLFDLIAQLWRTAGRSVQPIMSAPLFSHSLIDFWSRRWNLAFRDLSYTFLFRPLSKRFTARAANFVTFLVSGFIHELAISAPAGAGYGLPTLYFTLQGAGILFERSRMGKRCGLRRGVTGWTWTLLIVAGPVYFLFHPPFIERVILPFMSVIRAL